MTTNEILRIKLEKLQEFVRLVASSKRPDGTYNRCREALEVEANKVLKEQNVDCSEYEQSCKCKLCETGKRLKSIWQKLDLEDSLFINQFAAEYLHVSSDLDYYKSIMDGSWPNSEEILAKALSKIDSKKIKLNRYQLYSFMFCAKILKVSGQNG